MRKVNKRNYSETISAINSIDSNLVSDNVLPNQDHCICFGEPAVQDTSISRGLAKRNARLKHFPPRRLN